MKINKTAVAIMLTAACFCAGCGTTTNQPKPTSAAVNQISIKPESEKLFQEGLKAYENSDYNTAINIYDKALAADSKNFKAWSGKGVAYAMRGNSTNNQKDVAEGITYIQKALTLSPDYVPAFYDLALSYKIGHHYDDSIKWFKKVIEKEPDNTWSYYGIATIYGDQGNAREAVEYLQKAMALDKENVREAARSQAHFDSIRNDSAFKALVN